MLHGRPHWGAFEDKKMAGYISFFNLDKWFTETFSLDEQKIMEEKYSVGGIGDTPLFFGKSATAYNGSAAFFLADLTQWFNTKELSFIGLRLAKKAEELFEEQNESDINKHFFYMNMIKFYYKNRENEENLQKAIFYCEKQISISKQTSKAFKEAPLIGTSYLPSHTGFEQLAIIEKKNKNWNRVIELSEKAKSEGWAGDWDKRISEAKSKL